MLGVLLVSAMYWLNSDRSDMHWLISDKSDMVSDADQQIYFDICQLQVIIVL